MILLYAVGYMCARKRGQPRFYAGMSFFAGAMATLVLADDWLLLLAAWELIGFASYLLIGFWFDASPACRGRRHAPSSPRARPISASTWASFTLIGATGTSAIAPTLAVGGATVATVAGLLPDWWRR